MARLRGAPAADEHQHGGAGEGARGTGAGQLPRLRPALARTARPLLDEPYARRRELLDEPGPRWPALAGAAAFIGESGADIQAVSRRQHLEGVMAKRLQSRYEPGRRTTSWRKIKNVHRQEVVIGGWKPGEGGRAGWIGSLLVGVYDSSATTAGPNWSTAGTSAPGSRSRRCGCWASDWRRCAGPPRHSRHCPAGRCPLRTVGRARARGRRGVRRLDKVRAAASTVIQGTAQRQERDRGDP